MINKDLVLDIVISLYIGQIIVAYFCIARRSQGGGVPNVIPTETCPVTGMKEMAMIAAISPARIFLFMIIFLSLS
jgi:hypothetical protein